MSNLEELEVKNVCSLSCDAPTNTWGQCMWRRLSNYP